MQVALMLITNIRYDVCRFVIDLQSGKHESCFVEVFTVENLHIHVDVMNVNDSRLYFLYNGDTTDCKRH